MLVRSASCVQIRSYLPVLALAAPCSRLKLRRTDSLIALQVHSHFELLPNVVQQQGASDLLTHHQHFPWQLGMSSNDEAGHPLQPGSALQLLHGNGTNNNNNTTTMHNSGDMIIIPKFLERKISNKPVGALPT